MPYYNPNNVRVPMFGYYNVSTLATHSVCARGGILHTVSINSKGTGGNLITIYDSTTGSGDVICIIDPTTTIGTFVYDCVFVNGLTAVCATGASANITLTYK